MARILLVRVSVLLMKNRESIEESDILYERTMP